MIARFQVHDHGMERCRVVSSIPSWELLQKHNQTLHLAGDTSRIEVWNLTSSGRELDERKLSWASKPPRKELITTLSVAADSTHKSDEFWCGPSGSLQTIELLCQGTGCYIELWQDHYFQPRFGQWRCSCFSIASDHHCRHLYPAVAFHLTDVQCSF